MIKKPKNPPLLTAWPFVPDDPQFFFELHELLNRRVLSNRGPLVLRFEEDLKSYLGDPSLSPLTVSNATLGLELALRAFGLRGKVLVPSFTFVASAHAIVNAGL